MNRPICSQDLIVVGESQAGRLVPQFSEGAGRLLGPVITVLGNNNN
jgi:hypothetical protein